MGTAAPKPSAMADRESSNKAARPQAAGPRLRPAQILIALYWIGLLFVTLFLRATFSQFLFQFYAPMLLALGILVWWLGFSRLRWMERLSGVTALIAGGLLALYFADKSIPFALIMNGIPTAITAAVLWLVVTRGATTHLSWAGLVAVSLLSWGYFDLLRVDGVNGDLQSARSWRWDKTAEEKFLDERLATVKKEASTAAKSEANVTMAAEPVKLIASPGDWTEFRGPLRDGCLRGVEIDGDWVARPPKELWRRLVGPGWSSFAVIGDHVFTQEQRGESEAVVCVNLTTGQEIWSHEDKARFWEVVAGAGPRATPTFHEGKIYSLGGSGRLNCLDAATGRSIWSGDITEGTDIKPPQWGFSSSPLVVGNVVAVFAGGTKESKKDKGVFAYNAATGQKLWSAGQGLHSYSSPQLFKSGGGEQVLMISDYGLEAFEPISGKLLWDHKWYLDGMFRVCQPQVIGDSQFLIGTGMGAGTRLITVANSGEEWKVTESWTSKDLKPYFNDFVSRDGHLYGFDGDILVCVDLATGKKKWKQGRYGHGQALLLSNQGLLIVTTEETGEVVLAEVTPKGLNERGRIKALAGKTWNHPVIANGKLLVRNSEEMACYDIGIATALAAATR